MSLKMYNQFGFISYYLQAIYIDNNISLLSLHKIHSISNPMCVLDSFESKFKY